MSDTRTMYAFYVEGKGWASTSGPVYFKELHPRCLMTKVNMGLFRIRKDEDGKVRILKFELQKVEDVDVETRGLPSTTTDT